MRRVLIIVSIVVVLAGVGAAVYFYFFNKKAAVEVAPTGGTTLPTAATAQPSTSSGSGETSTAQSTPSPTTVSSRLVKITDGPVALGESVTSVPGTASSSAVTTVRYIERQSGNVFSYTSPGGTLTRTSNRTVPGVQSASWLPDGSLAFVRYLSGADFSTINTYGLKADGSDGFFLSQNLAGVAAASTSILTLASGVNGSVASVARTDGTSARDVFTTPLTNIRVYFAGKNQYLVVPKPSATLTGAAFLVDGSGNFVRVAGPARGLNALPSPSGKWALVSLTRGTDLALELIDTSTGEVLPLPVSTIVDKCVWAADDSAVYCGIPTDPPTAAYPDDWYQGAVSFSDRIWKIQVAGRYAQLVLDFTKETSLTLDAEALSVDPLTTTLVFVNKRDGSLWSYSL